MILALVLAVQADFAERLIAALPESAKLSDVVVTPDGKVAGYSLYLGKTSYVVRGDWRTKDYDLTYPLAISADGLHLLYMTITPFDGTHLRLNDRVLQTFDIRKGDNFRGNGALTRDGSIAVFTVGHQTERWWTYSVNGKNGTPHKIQYLGPPQISRDGKTIAGKAMMEDASELAIVNDVAGPVYEEVAGPAVSENGVVAYVVQKEDSPLALRHGDKVSKLDGPMPSDLFISADGTKLGFIYSDKGRFVKAGTKTSPKIRQIVRAVFDSKGERFAFWGIDEAGKTFVGIDDRLFDAPGVKTPPVFSPDGTQVGYAAQIGNELRWKVLDVPK